MKKILVISEVFYPENFLINDLVREWKKQGHTVDVISQYPSYPESYVFPGYENVGESVEEWEGSKIYRFPFIEGYKTSIKKKFANYLKFVRGASKIGKRIGGNYDVIFVSQTGPLTVAIPAIAIKKKFHKKISIWTFDIWPDVVYMYGVPRMIITKFFLDNLVRYIYKKFDNILVSSSGFKNSILKYVPNKTITYAPNWLQPVEFVTSEIQLDTNKFNYTFTGNISLYQNMLNVVKGFSLANIENAVLNIIGNGSSYTELKDYIENNNVQNVKLYKRVPYNQIDDILQHSDVFVLPLIANEEIEKTEPLKLQSYLSVGKPIYGILNGTCRAIIEENHLGLCAEPSNIANIAKGFKDIKTYAEDHTNEVYTSAQNLKRERFNKQKTIEKINRTIGID
ncbi:MAG: glycosyltransferase family 4 protein [Bacteroidales bacterium]|nr:glycosyltransferase family 4 protein [Bacteroidales bacterium]